MLKNAKTEYFNEHEEIATYLAIETLAEKVRDSETAKLARAIRREEEKMASFLQGQIKQLTGAVVREDIPAGLRRASSPKRKAPKKSAAKRSPAKKTSARKSTGRKKATAKKTGTKKAPRKKAAAKRR
jgi:rubrerythrin